MIFIIGFGFGWLVRADLEEEGFDYLEGQMNMWHERVERIQENMDYMNAEALRYKELGKVEEMFICLNKIKEMRIEAEQLRGAVEAYRELIEGGEDEK